MKLLQVVGINKKINEQPVLQDISLQLSSLHKLAIAGESGSGKSTLLKTIAGLSQPDTGEVLFEEEKVPGPNDKLIPGIPQIAYLSQHFELRNNYRVEEILEYANNLSEKEAAQIYEICHINHLLKRKTDQVSGGEKQRIALAKLLIGSPRLLLLDEPFSNLDIRHKNVLKSVIDRISDKLNITVLVVSHDPQDILAWADEIIIMRAGKIVQQDTPQKIYHQPVNTYVAGMIGKFSVIPVGMLKGRTTRGKYLFARPEHLKLVAAGDNLWSGTINKLFYLGSHWEAEIQLEHDAVTVKVDHGDYKKGELVYVTATADADWYW